MTAAASPHRRHAPTLAAALTLAATLSTTRSAHAGPTVAADLDLGTSVGQGVNAYVRGLNPSGGSISPPAALYVTGLRLRAGWRFDVGPVWILPEVGGGYDVERFQDGPSGGGHPLPRAFGGARAGVSLPLAPLVRFEPGIYGHAGYARYWLTAAPDNGLASDVGLALDLHLFRYLIVGAQVGYDVVTLWQPLPTSGPTTPPMSGTCPMTAFGTCTTSPTSTSTPAPISGGSVALADRWVSYGIHAGVLFW
jgi:hypothetical protein